MSRQGNIRRIKFQVIKLAEKPAGLACFSIIRNELYFLPHLLRHYRGLGVAHFIFYDDGSDDGGREYLIGQPDCTVLTSPHQFREPMWDGKPFHYHVRTAMPEHFVKGGWCLVVDADEFLILPRRFETLQPLIEELDARREIAVLAPMVDFYPATLRDRNYDFALGPFEGTRWWFDPDITFEPIPGTHRFQGLRAGFRMRLIQLLRAKDPDRLRQVYPWQEGVIYRSNLWKVPLIRTGQDIVRSSTHSINKPVASGIQLALAHFKFHPGTDRKIREALEWKSYAKDSVEYRMLEAAVECLEDENLVNERSIPFQGAESLEMAGMLFG